MTTAARHRQIVAAYREHGYTKAAEVLDTTYSTVYRHASGRGCSCLPLNGRSAPSSPPCLYGCPLTLAGHEVAPPRAGTYHERVWKRQVRAEVKHIDGQGGRWHDCAVGRVWVPE